MGNTVGSLTQNQRSIIIGTLLGDGYMRIIPRRKNAFLEVNHSSKQKDYVDWKYQELASIVKSGPKMRKGNGQRIAYRFFTQCLPEITELYRAFYENGKKIIPKDIRIDQLGLAVWFMDDGSRSGGSLYINTQQFATNDQERLQRMLEHDFNVSSTLNRDKEYMRIRIRKEDAQKFCNLIQSYIPESMRYKLV